MAFLIKDELKTVSTHEVIDLITKSDDTIVIEIIEESIDLMKSYMYKYYDTEKIFNEVDTSRSKVVLKYLKDIVIHEIYIRRTKVMNDVAKMRYDEAMFWLEKIASGKITPNLPAKPIDDNSQGNGTKGSFMRLGTRKSYKNHF